MRTKKKAYPVIFGNDFVRWLNQTRGVMSQRQSIQIQKRKELERRTKLRDKRYGKTDAEMQEEVLNEAKRILGLLWFLENELLE